jgi:hypothetical protein
MYVHPSIDKDSNYLYKYDNNVEFITCIKSLLTECEHTQGRQNKILVVRNIFTVICSNMMFVNNNNKFKQTVLDKLKELYLEEQSVQSEMNEYYHNITGEYMSINNSSQSSPISGTLVETKKANAGKKVGKFEDIGFSGENEIIKFLPTPENIQNQTTVDFKDVNNTIYQGEIENGKRNGYGKYWNNKFSYIGMWKDDLPNGHGLYTCIKKTYMFGNDIISYDGEWNQGIKENENDSKEVYMNGEYYVGQFKNNMINGIGKLYYQDGVIKYDSDQWVNGIPFTDCYYETKIQNQKAYVSIVDDKEFGYCRIFSNQLDLLNGLPAYIAEVEINGTMFTGNFKVFMNQKLRYRGSVINGFYEGYYESYTHDMSIEKRGLYKDGACMEGQIYEGGTLKYDGQFSQLVHYYVIEQLYILKEKRTCYHGKGKLYEYSGDKYYIYDGDFKNDKIKNGKKYDDKGNILFEGVFLYK